ncbi:MAG: hypothetical protein IPJ11_07935 [Gemmatimonadetes bacterium]|nr:hypothetical protein [Gemmatimonadota bacterium]
MAIRIAGFTIVRNATLLDFPLEASIRSLLPVVDEFVVNVGTSDDDTLDRVRAIDSPKIRILETTWDRSRGHAMLADETERAKQACDAAWGLYVQADEVFTEAGAERLVQSVRRRHADPRIEGLLVDYRHFYGGFDLIATNRSWYRRECRAVRLDPALAIHSFRDAQGFRVGPDDRRIRCARTGAVVHHYGWARPAWALAAKRQQDRSIYEWRQGQDPDRPLLPWIPGITPFRGTHPAVVAEWIAQRRTDDQLIAPRRWEGHHLGLTASLLIERATGWRPFEYRNYVTIGGANGIS